jgi:hypothetical protein
MNTTPTTEMALAPASQAAEPRKSARKRAGVASMLLLSTAAALFGLGLSSGTAQAEPITPAPQHWHHYCEWDHNWYWDDDFNNHCHHWGW